MTLKACQGTWTLSCRRQKVTEVSQTGQWYDQEPTFKVVMEEEELKEKMEERKGSNML